MEADKDRDGKISFEEFTKMVENTDVSMSMTLGMSFVLLLELPSLRELLSTPHQSGLIYEDLQRQSVLSREADLR